MRSIENQIRQSAVSAQLQLDEMYSSGPPPPGSPLEQVGLRDGLDIVEDYLSHNEAGLALEHLLYMVFEPPLKLTEQTLADISSAAEALNMSGELAKYRSS